MIYKPYKHLVQYYETDQMGIVHHSNYIRWFEEARSFLLEENGFGYKKMEESGIIRQAESDGQVKMRTFLEQISRRKIERYAFGRQA